MDEFDQELDARMRQYATQAVGSLEDMRGLARDVGKFIDRGGLPVQFQRQATEVLAAVETLEAGVSEYAVQLEEA